MPIVHGIYLTHCKLLEAFSSPRTLSSLQWFNLQHTVREYSSVKMASFFTFCSLALLFFEIVVTLQTWHS